MIRCLLCEQIHKECSTDLSVFLQRLGFHSGSVEPCVDSRYWSVQRKSHLYGSSVCTGDNLSNSLYLKGGIKIVEFLFFSKRNYNQRIPSQRPKLPQSLRRQDLLCSCNNRRSGYRYDCLCIQDRDLQSFL
jgi:hypothetical protein